MSKKIKNEQKKFLGETLNQYDKALSEGIDQLDKKNREQNHKISSLVNSFDNEYLEKDVEGNMTALENSKDGMVIINEIQGSTEVNYCKDGEKELILNGDIDTQGESFVTITEGVDGGLVDVSLEGNTEINLSKTKDPVLVTREFDDINCNVGKLQYTIDDVTTINDEPGKVDIDRIVGDTMVNHAVNGSEELILNAHINESGDNNITLNGVTSDGGKVDVALEGNTLVNVSKTKDDYITPTIEDKVDQGSVISLPEVSEGLIHIDEIEGNTLVNYCTDGAKELTLNGDIDIEGTFVTTTEGVDNGKVDVYCEGNTLVNLVGKMRNDTQAYYTIDENYITILDSETDHRQNYYTISGGQLNLIKPNTTYTIIAEITKNTLQRNFTLINNYQANQGDITSDDVSVPIGFVGRYVGKFTTVSDFTNRNRLGFSAGSGNRGEITLRNNFIILEGDWTNRELPTSYFEGMKSVGQDDENGHKIEILSQSKNLLKPTREKYPYFIKKGEKLTLSTKNGVPSEGGNVLLYDINNKVQWFPIDAGQSTRTLTTNSDIYYMQNQLGGNGNIEFQVEKGTVATSYVPYSVNKKEILLNEPLRAVGDTKDRFVQIDGKWYVERNVAEVVLDGSSDEGWTASITINKRYSSKNGIINSIHLPNEILCYCDKIKYITTNQSDNAEKGIALTNGNRIMVNTDYNSLDEFKTWLQSNPVTVIYRLASPTYEPVEISPVLNTYTDVTHITNNSTIPMTMNVKNSGYNTIIKPSTQYTIALDTNKSGTVGINLGGAKVTTTNNVATITTPATLADDSLRLYGKGIKASKVRLLEGDKTNWIPSFFEGIKSSFEDKVQDDGSYRMEVLMNNVNLLDIQNISFKNTADYTLENNKIIINSSKKYQAVYYYIPVKRGITYTICCKNITGGTLILLYRGKITGHVVEKYLGSIYDTSLKKRVIADEDYITIRVSNENSINTECIFEDILFYEGTEEIEYIPNKSNKIQLSSIEPLRGKDRLVFVNGKLMIKRNNAEKILNGTEKNWAYDIATSTQEVGRFGFNNIGMKDNRSLVICDKYPFKTQYTMSSYNYEGVFTSEGGSTLFLDTSLNKLETKDISGFKKWLSKNPVKIVYELAEPTYEEIPYNLQKIILESYTNGILFIDTNIPPTKVSFNCFEEELTYLYPATSYTVQFMSDRNTTADITLGGTSLLAQNVVVGLNRMTITTPTELVDNKLVINGTGANISEVVVTDTDREFKYFEGMKSVGECEDLEVVSSNSDGTLSNTQTLTHEPLRAVEDIKDKYVLIDGKWYIERNTKKINASDLEWTDVGINSSFAHGRRYIWANVLTGARNHSKLNVICKDYVSIPYNNYDYDGECVYVSDSKIYLYINDTLEQFLVKNPEFVTFRETPIYEPIDYNPLEVYSDITHITTNSTIPTNITVKNHGYNVVALKENTQYTLYVDKNTTNALTYRLGDYVEINSPSKFTFTTPSTLTDKTLRIDGKGTKVKDLMLIEGTPTNDPVGYFDGLKSSYECEQVIDENDVNYGKYKVDIKVVGKNKLNIPSAYNTWKGGKIAVTDGNIVTCTPASDGTQAMDYQTVFADVDFKKGTQLTLSATKIFGADYTSGSFGIGIYLRDAKGSLINGGAYRCPDFLGDDPIDTVRTTTITLTQDVAQIGLYIIAWKIQGASGDYKFKVQLEEGDTATEYESYFESTQTIYLNSPLLKGDEIVWKDNKIQHYHKMKAVVFDGSDDEEWRRQPELDNDTTERYWIEKINNNQLLDVKINTISYNDKFDNIAKNNTCLYTHPTNTRVDLRKLKTDIRWTDLNSLKQWLQANPVTVVYQLETPYYEEISDYPLKLNVIANSSLSTESTIQVTNISFNIYEETLPYLYPNTKYYITFNADVDRNNIIINLGGNHVVLDCKVGFNKVEITTPSDITNLLTFSGTGVNINHVKVTQQDIDEYFEGMKSVGECEELEITSANSDNTLLNTQQLPHEPLRAVGDAKDRYVLIDGKWYIERNCREMIITSEDISGIGLMEQDLNNGYERYSLSFHSMTNYRAKRPYQKLLNNSFYSQVGWKFEGECMFLNEDNSIGLILNKNRNIGNNHNKLREFLTNNPVKFIYELASPVYEPIDYNPFETYADITHISANSLIPTNVVIKNHGYNCILKPSTKYTIALNKPNGTISAKLGGSEKVDSTNSIFTITTPSTLNDNVLRLSGSGKVKDIMILEGDKTVNTPSYFEGIESVFEQEYDVEKGKYRVTARVEGNGKESSIIFYINEPLRGTGTAKDKVFIQDSKVVVQRNCGSVNFDGSERMQAVNINDKTIEFFLPNSINETIDNMACICNTIPYGSAGVNERTTPYKTGIYITINKNKLNTQDVSGFKQWLSENPTTVVYALAEPVYEEVDCDLSKLVLENYENSSLIFESNIPVSANIKYSGEVPVVTQAKSLSSQVDNTTLDINENIIPYMCDIDYRIVELQLMNGDTQGEGIELLGIGDIEILGNENVLFNNREDKKYNYSYDMLKRDILSQRYSKEEYQYRLDRYLLANKISDEEYKELEGLLNNGE